MKKLLFGLLFLINYAFAEDYKFNITQIRNSTNKNVSIQIGNDYYSIESYDIKNVNIRTNNNIKIINNEGLLGTLISTDTFINNRKVMIATIYYQKYKYTTISCIFISENYSDDSIITINTTDYAAIYIPQKDAIYILKDYDEVCKSIVDKYEIKNR